MGLPGGQINDPSSGERYVLLFLPATHSSLPGTLEGLFGLTWLPSKAPSISSRKLLLTLYRYKAKVRCGMLCMEVK